MVTSQEIYNFIRFQTPMNLISLCVWICLLFFFVHQMRFNFFLFSFCSMPSLLKQEERHYFSRFVAIGFDWLNEIVCGMFVHRRLATISWLHRDPINKRQTILRTLIAVCCLCVWRMRQCPNINYNDFNRWLWTMHAPARFSVFVCRLADMPIVRYGELVRCN